MRRNVDVHPNVFEVVEALSRAGILVAYPSEVAKALGKEQAIRVTTISTGVALLNDVDFPESTLAGHRTVHCRLGLYMIWTDCWLRSCSLMLMKTVFVFGCCRGR